MIHHEFAHERGINHYELAYQHSAPYFYNKEKRALVVVADTDENIFQGFLEAVPLDFYLRPQPEEIERDLQPDGFCDQLLIWDEYDEFLM